MLEEAMSSMRSLSPDPIDVAVLNKKYMPYQACICN
ncbi:hypothetical protein KGM_214611 [Danaus plexippus plexippus]|uniref:Uncharacterized protein n=1 Tax=Danaus plexippus plexippus TaxID=278856 RepID=A0A212F7J5_DANPL|nr:hypothetical protein KGM_214611 [Danaus plexippus plexippus]